MSLLPLEDVYTMRIGRISTNAKSLYKMTLYILLYTSIMDIISRITLAPFVLFLLLVFCLVLFKCVLNKSSVGNIYELQFFSTISKMEFSTTQF